MSIRTQNVDKSKFDLSHTHKTTLDMGKLIPIATIPTLPGDVLNVDTSAFIRAMPTIAPIMDKIDIKVNHFFVPYRILWEKFPEFITHSNDYKLTNKSAPTLPQLDATSILHELSSYDNTKFGQWFDSATVFPEGELGRLADYIGLHGVGDSILASKDLILLMPFLAYNKIFLDYYVPQRWLNFYQQRDGEKHPLLKLKMQLEEVKKSNNFLLDSNNFFDWKDKGKLNLNRLTKDNFGSSGSKYANLLALKNVYWNHDYFTNALPEPTIYGDVKLPLFNENTPDNQKHLIASGGSRIEFESSGNYANASDIKHNNSVLANIRDLRKAISMQHYFEYLTQGGGRYLETMHVMWNKNLPEPLLQMSEYLGGDVVNLFVNEVESTAGTQTTKLGDVAGKPVGAGSFDKITFEADEFGIYMVLAHIVPKRSYSIFTERYLRQLDALDFPNPAFEGIGDQPIYNYELGEGTNRNVVLGYVPRYSDYKTKVDRFSGDMIRGLKYWHLGENNVKTSQITPEWFECIPREDIFQVPGERDKFYGVFSFNIDALRPLSYQTPIGLSRI